MVCENRIVAPVAKQGSPEISNTLGRFDPTGCLDVKNSQLLKCPVLFFRQQLNTHFICHIHRAFPRLVFFTPLQRFPVITDIPSSFRTLRRAIEKQILVRFGVIGYDIRLTSDSSILRSDPSFSGFSVIFRRTSSHRRPG